jgi:hypothetical protein
MLSLSLERESYSFSSSLCGLPAQIYFFKAKVKIWNNFILHASSSFRNHTSILSRGSTVKTSKWVAAALVSRVSSPDLTLNCQVTLGPKI